MVLIHIKRNGLHSFINLRAIFTIFALLLFTQCQNKPEEKVKPAIETEEDMVSLTAAQLKNAPIETVMLSEKNIGTVLKLNGKIWKKKINQFILLYAIIKDGKNIEVK